MSRVVKGTGDARKQAQVVKGPSDVRRVRCTKCKSGFAVQVPDGKGGQIYDCQICHARFNYPAM